MARLGDICEILNGYAFKSEKYISSGIRIIRIANVQKGYIEDTAPAFYPIDTPDVEKYTLYEDDLLISLTGNVGRVALLKKEFLPAALNQRVACLRLKNGVPYDKLFLYCFLNSDYFENECIQSAKGVAQKNMSTEWLKEYEVPDLSLEKQREIATVLNKLSDLINFRQQQIIKLDELVKTRFVEMFGDILCDSDLPLVQLKELADVGSSKRIYANEYVDSGVPFYRSKEIRELGTGLKPSVELFIKQERYDEIKEKYGVPKIGDILIAAIGATIGYSWIVDTDKPFYYKDGNLIILSTKNNVNPIFLNHTIGILIGDFKNKGVAGSAQLALTIEKLEKMMVVNPSINSQNQFADFVKQIDKSKLSIQQSLEKLETLKKSLMQQYFG